MPAPSPPRANTSIWTARRVARRLRNRRLRKRIERANGLAAFGLEKVRERGSGQIDRDEASAAVSALRRAIVLRPEAPHEWRVSLAEALVVAGAAPEEVEAAYRDAIVRSPLDGGLVNAWITQLRARSIHVDEHLFDVQKSVRTPLIAVLVRLLSGDLRDRALLELSDPISAFLGGGAANLCRKVWEDFGGLQPLDPQDCKRLGRLSSGEVRLYFLARPQRILTFEAAAAAADELGLTTDALRWWEEEFLVADHPPQWPERDFVNARMRTLAETDDLTLAYQTRIVRDRRLVLRDPHSGAEVAPFDAVLPFGRTVYSFGDRELTMLVTAGLGNRAAILLFPLHNTILDLGAKSWHHFAPVRLASMSEQVLRRAARHREAYETAVAERADPPRVRSVVLMTNSVENPAHHLWNCFPGVEKIIEHGIAANVDEIHTAGSEFYGPFVELFPEFAGATVVEDARRGVRDPHPFSNRHILVAPGGYFIRRTLVERLIAHMAALPNAGGAVPPPADVRPFPVVWIGLRVGSRSWVDQEHEVPRLIDAIHDRHPQALVLLDGFSYPLGRDEVSSEWQSSIERIHVLSRTILDAVADPDRVVDMVGNTMRESVLWAAVTDVYLAPSGSSQHKVGWVSDGPGIAYGPQGLVDVPSDWRPGAREAEGRPEPVTIVGTVESAGERRSSTDLRSNLDNIRLDLDEVTTTVLRLIEERQASRGDPP